ncbi:MAG: SH3 domain-containing protein [Desulfobacteraceae bacterium]|nr:SH3 domain-containing protein [Desulfobacteraceae bacterium]
MPARESVQLAPGSSSDTVAHEAPAEEYSKLPSEAIGNQAATPLKRNDNNARLASPAGAVDQQNVLSPPETEKRPVKEVDKASLQAGAETGKRLFVKVHVGNVREEPSTTSRVKFRLEMGDPVTVTGKRGGWVAVKLDDGRFGWVYHTLLTDSIVPQKATARATREIKAIRPEVAAKDVAKVIFELNGPFPPQTMIVEGEKPRVVCDFFDAGLASDIGDSIEVNNGIVEKIRTGMHKWPEFKVRVVLDLVPERNYEVDQIFFEKENYYVLVVKAKE